MALDLHMKNGFRAISFENSNVLDSYFMIIIRVIALDLGMKNSFRAISFEYIGELDSYFTHMYIIIKYRSSLIKDKIKQLLSELWPLISI